MRDADYLTTDGPALAPEQNGTSAEKPHACIECRSLPATHHGLWCEPCWEDGPSEHINCSGERIYEGACWCRHQRIKGGDGSIPEPGETVAESGGKSLPPPLSPLTATSSQRPEGFPRPLGEDAYQGLAGDIVRSIEPHTEADPAALLASALVCFGSLIDRGPWLSAGDSIHYTNLAACIVGATGIGRKGTSFAAIAKIFTPVDPTWGERVVSGLVSGEGVIYHVRDERRQLRKARKGELGDVDGMVEEIVDPGVKDKRLMVMVPEFAQVLAAIGRRDNTLSPVLRDAWDRGNLQTLAKNSPDRATGAHVSVLAHITPTELRNRLDTTEIANGFANRYLFIASHRSKLLPHGGNTPMSVVDELVPKVKDAVNHARTIGHGELHMTEEARRLYAQEYERLTDRPDDLFGAITGRATAIVRRVALLYALMDKRLEVGVEHLRAALELWRYVEESVRWAFGDAVGDTLADTCLEFLREAGSDGLTRTELRDELGHRITSKQTKDALEHLAKLGLAWKIQERTRGRRADRWHATVLPPPGTEGDR